MEKGPKEKLRRLLKDKVRFECPLAPYTTLGVGGPAEALCEVGNSDCLKQVVTCLYDEGIPCFALGRGSNLLIKDNGLKGVAIRLCGELAGISEKKTISDCQDSETEDFILLTTGGGGSISDLLTYCRANGRGGLEFLAGVPGTVGGAVSMNAGAFGEEIGSRVQSIRIMTYRGDLLELDHARLLFSYRNLKVEHESIIIEASFRLIKEDKGVIVRRVAGYLKTRKENQPLEYASAGSIFKNPPGQYAARLIQEAGLKGRKQGNARISEKHANFIVNTGGASARDILALVEMARETVKQKTGINLETEIKIIGH